MRYIEREKRKNGCWYDEDKKGEDNFGLKYVIGLQLFLIKIECLNVKKKWPN